MQNNADKVSQRPDRFTNIVEAISLLSIDVTGCVINGTRESQMMTPARTV